MFRITGGSRRDPGGATSLVPAAELIWDGNIYAYRYLRAGEFALHVETNVVQPPLSLIGPFTWRARFRLDRDLDAHDRDCEVERKTETRAGRRLEVEIYKRAKDGHIRHRTIAYDPEIGYVPRFVRLIAYSAKDGRSTASFSEIYVIGAQQCAAGGFVPTEWYLITGHIADFQSRYPDYSDETRIAPTDTPMVFHFRATKIEEQRGPVALDEIDGVTDIWAPGGSHRVKGDLQHLSVERMKKLLGEKLIRHDKPLVANIDHRELHEFDQQPRRFPWLAVIAGGLAVIAVYWIFRGLKRYAALAVLACVAAATGCGQRPIPLLTAGFIPGRIIYDASRPSLQLKLGVTNAGNRDIRIFSVDAGCSCRHVDASELPTSLRPGESLKLALSMSGELG